ncbi:pyrroline-5-carboxylate reductase family protein [Streptomyces sp. NBC_01601]|uniref:pyrroline-5-carboxylate reductase family protein n=1 Tax=Streptomyces sp. NBC_01601 TaxID=2975892 RepID=UPI002E28C90E|nr:pyrroline-5-carboxylate reductase [Streptomyces sp. NBC_01601]
MERIVVVGAGHMGSVIVHGLLDGLPHLEVVIVEPSAQRRASLDSRAEVAAAYEPRPGDLLVLAIPPQALESFADGLPPKACADATVVSIMAGVRLETLASTLGTGAVLRAMPNLAARVGQSMTVVCPGPRVPPEAVQRTERALSVIGRVLAVEDESLLDAATAVAGSGPALVAYLAQSFTDFARGAGFDAPDAAVLTSQVLRGTAEVLAEPGVTPESLYREASTPHGTTARGIATLREHRVGESVRAALEATAERAGELAG